nr:MAG TPA: hypothetical protein [Caudoviricetes sp.]
MGEGFTSYKVVQYLNELTGSKYFPYSEHLLSCFFSPFGDRWKSAL